MADQIKKKKKTRASHKGYVAKLLADVEASMAEFTEEMKPRMMQFKTSLEIQLEALTILDKEILELLEEKEEVTEEELATEIEESFSLRADLKTKLNIVEQLLAPEPQSSTPTIQQSTGVVTSPTRPAVRARLPKLEVKKFRGHVHEWQEFWDAFESSIHKNESLSDVDKFAYLRGLMEGPAKATIAGFALTAANYGAAIQQLERRFGKKTAIQRAHISEMMKMTPVCAEKDPEKIRTLYDTVETHYRGLVALGVDEETYSSIVVPALLGKLPEALRLTITRGQSYLEWTLGDMLAALLKEVELREECHLTPHARSVTSEPRYEQRRTTPSTASTLFTKHVGPESCAFCRGSHPHEDCRRVRDFKERKNLIRKYGRCFNCLRKGHCARDCKVSVTCKNCQSNHHAALCEGRLQRPRGGGDAQVNVSVAPSSLLVGTGSRIALQTAQALIKGRGQGRVRVLFDSGSHRSFITNRAVSECGISVVRREWLSISTFGQSAKQSGLRDVVQFDVTPLHGGKVLSLEAYVVPEISRISNEHLEVVKHDFPHLRDLWFSDVSRSKDQLEVDLLIGADYLWNFQKGRTIRGKVEEPVAVETELGWVLSGPLKRREVGGEDEVSVNFIAQDSVASDRQSLENAVGRLWDLESIGIRTSGDVQESFEDEIRFTGKRYSVKLPWKRGHAELPSNYANSLSRMKSQVRKLRKEPEVLQEYDAIIKEQLRSGIIEEVVELEKTDKVHYLPHQAVIRRDATTTKLRIVYDASSKAGKREASLNECLHVGPSLNSLLFDILVRFRENRITLVGDIEKAFLNVEVDEGDRDCLRFLWAKDALQHESEIVVYRFCRVVFGLNASPFLLNGTLRHHLATFADVDPRFVRKMIDDFYVDDLVTGESTTAEACSLYEKAEGRMEIGGFKLRKWRTNDPTLREKIRASEANAASPKKVSTLEEEETYAKSTLDTGQQGPKGQKVLGLPWDNVKDTIQFDLLHVVDKAKELQPTKRNVLRVLAGLFDPLGIISPVVVSMKILFQELCCEKLDWDDELTGELKRRWEKWIEDLLQTKKITISRCLYETGDQEVMECYLHGFGDASKKAYCAMVYIVYRTKDGTARARLVVSKTRVAPLTVLTIPRLELMSARILAQLMNTVSKALQSQLRLDGRRYWLDSKTALCWIQNRGEWKQFVQHRVNEILSLTKKGDWQHCPGKENPADLGSRGAHSAALRESQLWWEGPAWLSGPQSGWPAPAETRRTPETAAEEKKCAVMMASAEVPQGVSTVINLERYNKFERLIRVTAWVRRFVRNLKLSCEGDERRTGKLGVEELLAAEKEWIKSAQLEVKQQTNFRQLECNLGVVEEDGILRCEGRLGNSDLEISARKPILLPKDHKVTEMIVSDCHERVHHCGVRATLAEMRSRHWVPKGRQMVKRVIGKCVTCKRLEGKPYGNPPMAPLPDFRVREAAPFSKVGVDFAGPLFVKGENGGMNKVYIALFSCCVTRAVHLDLVEDLSASVFMRCLRKFVARRGTPSLLISDNAQTFKATAKTLKALYDHPQVRADLEVKRILWKFNLERAPWWGGFFERMVGCVKRSLRKVLGNARLTFDELLTTIVEVEGTLNSRPLTYEYEELDEEALTPSHLIYGRRIKSVNPGEVLDHEEEEANTGKRFAYLSRKLVHFWNRWQKEYLADLREFHKCKSGIAKERIQEGDVVTVYEEGRKRGSWRTAVVESLVKGKDEVVRGANVRVLSRGKPARISRPIQLLYPLEIKSACKDVQQQVPQPPKEIVALRRAPKRAAALDSSWKTRQMLDS